MDGWLSREKIMHKISWQGGMSFLNFCHCPSGSFFYWARATFLANKALYCQPVDISCELKKCMKIKRERVDLKWRLHNEKFFLEPSFKPDPHLLCNAAASPEPGHLEGVCRPSAWTTCSYNWAKLPFVISTKSSQHLYRLGWIIAYIIIVVWYIDVY